MDPLRDAVGEAQLAHATEDELIERVEGRLENAAGARLEAHLSRCTICDIRLAAVELQRAVTSALWGPWTVESGRLRLSQRLELAVGYGGILDLREGPPPDRGLPSIGALNATGEGTVEQTNEWTFPDAEAGVTLRLAVSGVSKKPPQRPELALRLWFEGGTGGTPRDARLEVHAASGKSYLSAGVADLREQPVYLQEGRWIATITAAFSATGRRVWEIPIDVPWRKLAELQQAFSQASGFQAHGGKGTKDGTLRWVLIEEPGGVRLRMVSTDPDDANRRLKVRAGEVEDELTLEEVNDHLWEGTTRKQFPAGARLTFEPA